MTGIFRAWDKKQKRYAPKETLWDLYIASDGKVMGKEGIAQTAFLDVTDRYDIEWETGKQDKNGQRISEGDRMGVPSYPGHISYSAKTFPAIIEHDGVSFVMRCEDGRLEPIDSIYNVGLYNPCRGESSYGTIVEIIGTIHDEKGSE